MKGKVGGATLLKNGREGPSTLLGGEPFDKMPKARKRQVGRWEKSQ